jgi:hypothetical protein
MLKSIIIGFLTVILAMFGFGAYSLYIVADPYIPTSCIDQIRQEIKSPNGAFVATVFDRSCGDSTSYSSKMVIMRESKHPLHISSGGEIQFPHKTVEPEKEQDVVLVVDSHQQVILLWRTDKVLEVKVFPVGKLKNLSSWQSIKIRYK